MIRKTVPHSKILKKLGGREMGVVCKAQDLKLERFVAPQFLPQDLTREDEAEERFVHEAKADDNTMQTAGSFVSLNPLSDEFHG